VKRNRYGICILILALDVLLASPPGLLAQEGEEGALVTEPPVAEETLRPTFSADMSFFSQYVWRGTGLSDTTCVVQPSLTVEYWGFSLNLWGNLDANVPADQPYPPWNETDMTVAFDHSFGPVGVGVGYIYYALHGIKEHPLDATKSIEVPDSQEAYIRVGVDTILSPSFTVSREFAYYPGWYLNLGVSQSFDLIKDHLSLDLAGSMGYLDADGGPGCFNDAMVSAGFTIPFGEYFSVNPVVAYTFYLSGAAMDNLMAGSVDGKADHIYGGATISVAF
jgi:hypothetical protein